MNQAIRLIQIIGSPFSSPPSQIALNDSDLSDLYILALRNKIGLYFLEVVKRYQDLGNLLSEYDEGYSRYKETVITAAGISDFLNDVGVEHAIFKFIKPYPSTPSDVDVLFLCSNDEYRKALDRLFANGYFRLGTAPHQVIAYDLRGGTDNMDTRLKGGKRGGIYYIDLYDEVAASHVIYMSKQNLNKCVTKMDFNGQQVKTLKPEAELAVTFAHSGIPEQLYTLADYYTTLHYLVGRSEEDIDNCMNILQENNITLVARSSIKITALLHQAAHGFIPEMISKALVRLNAENPTQATDLPESGFEMPCKYSLSTVIRAMLEKLRERKFTISAIRQVIAMLNPSFGKKVIDDLVERRRRETY